MSKAQETLEALLLEAEALRSDMAQHAYRLRRLIDWAYGELEAEASPATPERLTLTASLAARGEADAWIVRSDAGEALRSFDSWQAAHDWLRTSGYRPVAGIPDYWALAPAGE